MEFEFSFEVVMTFLMNCRSRLPNFNWSDLQNSLNQPLKYTQKTLKTEINIRFSNKRFIQSYFSSDGISSSYFWDLLVISIPIVNSKWYSQMKGGWSSMAVLRGGSSPQVVEAFERRISGYSSLSHTSNHQLAACEDTISCNC